LYGLIESVKLIEQGAASSLRSKKDLCQPPRIGTYQHASRQVSALENEFGIVLFERVADELTPVSNSPGYIRHSGERLLQRCLWLRPVITIALTCLYHSEIDAALIPSST
jgi:hypothetical protein